MPALRFARRMIAAAVCAAGIAAVQADESGIQAMTPMQARQFALQEIRALAAIANAGGRHPDPQCQAAASLAGDLGAAAIDQLVQADKSLEAALRAGGPEGAHDPAVQLNYRSAASEALKSRQRAAGRAVNCPAVVALHL